MRRATPITCTPKRRTSASRQLGAPSSGTPHTLPAQIAASPNRLPSPPLLVSMWPTPHALQSLNTLEDTWRREQHGVRRDTSKHTPNHHTKWRTTHHTARRPPLHRRLTSTLRRRGSTRAAGRRIMWANGRGSGLMCCGVCATATRSPHTSNWRAASGVRSQCDAHSHAPPQIIHLSV